MLWLLLPRTILLLLFSRPAMSSSLQLYGLQPARPLCPSPSPEVCPSSCPLCISDGIQPSHPLMPSSPSALNLFQHQGLFQWVSSLHQMTKIKEFQLQHQSFQWVSGLIYLKIDWFDLLTVQGNLRSLLQHPSSKASIFLALCLL